MGQKPSSPAALIAACAASDDRPALDLSGLGLADVPADVYELARLVELDLSDNALVTSACACALAACVLLRSPLGAGAVHSRLYQMPALQRLNLSFNSLSRLPYLMGEMRCITHLLLHQNALKALPDEVTLLRNLRVLNVSYNEVSGGESIEAFSGPGRVESERHSKDVAQSICC
jgi:Leucine-rich repeat (LRR) protein